MKKLLLTGFAPFGGEQINPSWEAVKALPDTVGGYSLYKLEVPVVYGLAGETVWALAREACPDVILCIGQAGGRGSVTPERIAINIRCAGIPDNHGNMPQDTPVIPGAPDGIFSTVPVETMAASIRNAGLPGTVSNTAGTFVCNDLLFTLLHHCAGTAVRVGFIHVPFLPEQAKEGVPAMPLEDIEKALAAAICALN